MNKKIITLIIILIVVLAITTIVIYKKNSFISKNISTDSLPNERVISSKGNIRVLDEPGDNPLCGKITLAKDNRVVASFDMCEENITDVEYGLNSVTLKTDGGMLGKPNIEINLVSGVVSRK